MEVESHFLPPWFTVYMYMYRPGVVYASLSKGPTLCIKTRNVTEPSVWSPECFQRLYSLLKILGHHEPFKTQYTCPLCLNTLVGPVECHLLFILIWLFLSPGLEFYYCRGKATSMSMGKFC